MNPQDIPTFTPTDTRLIARLKRALREPSKITRRLRTLPLWIKTPGRSLPHGLFSWDFVFKPNDPRHRFHWQANRSMRGRWPRLLWVLYQYRLALRWRRRFAELETDRVVGFYGDAVESAEGIPRAE